MSQSIAASSQHSAALIRLVLFAVLAAVEILVISFLFVFDYAPTDALPPQYYVRQLALLSLTGALAFAVLSWPKREALIASWIAAVKFESWRVPLIVNLVLFAILAVATVEFSRRVATVTVLPLGLFAAYLVPLGATGLSLMWLAAPINVWRFLFRDHWIEIALAAVAGLIALWAGVIAKSGWSVLAELTLKVSYGLLSLYESQVRADFGQFVLAVGNFEVYIDEACSGYEGIGLVAVFLTLFLWVFRRSLRFPNALVLLPIGIGLIWLLNSVRIAALVSIGAHISPEVALSGFHSQAGWIAFLSVTIGIMVFAPRLSFFAADGGHAVVERPASEGVIVAFLAPFMCLMAASIVVAASAPYDTLLYGLKVVSVGVCLWACRDVYRSLVARVEPFALACGAVIGILWVVTAPSGEGSDVAAWIAAQPLWLVVAWLIIRAIGSIVMVPIAEELAFRGLLHRWLISRRFESVDFAQFSWIALIVSSLLFGLMHQRWIAGTLAGVAFAVTMYRSGRLSDPIAAHMVANAVIVAWAVASGNWSLL